MHQKHATNHKNITEKSPVHYKYPILSPITAEQSMNAYSTVTAYKLPLYIYQPTVRYEGNLEKIYNKKISKSKIPALSHCSYDFLHYLQ